MTALAPDPLIPDEPLVRPRNRSVMAARRMFDVLRDDAQNCMCHLHSGQLCTDGFGTMRIPAAEYDRPDRVFL